MPESVTTSLPVDQAHPDAGQDVPGESWDTLDPAVVFADLGAQPQDQQVPDRGQAETYEVTVNGQPRKATLDELRQGFMLQSDYTRKTQELAEARRQLTPLENLAYALDADPAGTLQLLAKELGVDLGQPTQEPTTTQPNNGQATTQAPQSDPKIAQHLERIEQRFQADDQQRAIAEARTQITSDLQQLHNVFGDFPEEDVVKFCVDYGIADVKLGFAAWSGDQQLRNQLEQRQTQQENTQQAAKQQAGVVDMGGSRAPDSVEPGTPGKKMTIREALTLAMRQHGMS